MIDHQQERKCAGRHWYWQGCTWWWYHILFISTKSLQKNQRLFQALWIKLNLKGSRYFSFILLKTMQNVLPCEINVTFASVPYTHDCRCTQHLSNQSGLTTAHGPQTMTVDNCKVRSVESISCLAIILSSPRRIRRDVIPPRTFWINIIHFVIRSMARGIFCRLSSLAKLKWGNTCFF